MTVLEKEKGVYLCTDCFVVIIIANIILETCPQRRLRVELVQGYTKAKAGHLVKYQRFGAIVLIFCYLAFPITYLVITR